MSKYPKGKGVTICPFHSEETPSCLLDMEKKEFYCFGCEKKGTFKIEFFPEEKK